MKAGVESAERADFGLIGRRGSGDAVVRLRSVDRLKQRRLVLWRAVFVEEEPDCEETAPRQLIQSLSASDQTARSE